MQSGESSPPIPAIVDAPSSTFEECQGFDSYFFIDSNEQDAWTIDWVKVQLEFENGTNLMSYAKVNRALGSANSGDVLRKIGTTETNGDGAHRTKRGRSTAPHWPYVGRAHAGDRRARASENDDGQDPGGVVGMGFSPDSIHA